MSFRRNEDDRNETCTECGGRLKKDAATDQYYCPNCDGSRLSEP